MNDGALNRVLACRTLPSLPGVALQVMELTRDASVRIDDIAKLVQNDPALTAKILRTVNSSYYSLSTPCPTINRAVSLLGLNTVKSLVLGFSLVDFTSGAGKRGVDLTAYWRRAIYTAAGARLLAGRTGACDPEEAFIGALLQDVGMLAAHAALGDTYIRVLAAAPDDHDELANAELAALGFDHASVGSKLMEKWKLPPHVVECTRRHHQPEQAAPAHAAVVRLVALAMDAAAVMTLADHESKLARFRARAQEWFSIRPEDVEGLLEEIADEAARLSSLLNTPTGERPNIASLLADANERLTMHHIEIEQEASVLQQCNQELTRQVTTDPLTGVANRTHFDAEIAACFDKAARGGSSVALLFVDADNFKSVNDTLGHQVGDAALVELARRLREKAGLRGTVCRYGGEEFVVILPGMTAEQAGLVAEVLRHAIESMPIDIAAFKLAKNELRLTISVGVAGTDQGGFDTPASLVHAADKAAYLAKHGGRNCVRTAAVTGLQLNKDQRTGGAAPESHAPAKGLSVVLVEDDPLAAKLLELVLSKRRDICLRIFGSAEEALRAYSGRVSPPDVLLCDLDLPGIAGVELIKTLRKKPAWRDVPILALSTSSERSVSATILSAGATEFVTKADLCSDFGKWVEMVVGLCARHRIAA